MKILIINPPRFKQVWVGIPDIFNSRNIYLYPPLAIMTISGYLKKHFPQHTIEMLDADGDGLTPLQTGERIKEISPHIVGIRTLTHNLIDVAETIKEARKVCPEAHIVLGGPHARAYPEKAASLAEVDSAIPADAEVTLGILADTLEKGESLEKVEGLLWRKNGEIIKNPPRDLIHDLDTIPFPDRKPFLHKNYFTPAMRRRKTTTIMSSRGCPNRCIYCSTDKAYRSRTPVNIVDEVEVCVNELGIEEILFLDDTFNINNERVAEVCQEILKRKIKFEWGFKGACARMNPELLELAREAGCTKIHYGVETTTDEGLKAINKKVTIEQIMNVFKWTRKAKIRAIAFMMMGCPHEKTREDVLKAKEFIRKLTPDYVVYSAYSPYPDAPAFGEGVKLGLWEADCWEKFLHDPKPDHNLPTFWSQHFSADELLDLFKILHRDFYYRPATIMRSMSNLKSFEELKRLLRGGISLLKMELMKTGRI